MKPSTILLYSASIPEPIGHSLVDPESVEWLSGFGRWLYRRIGGVIKPPRVRMADRYISMHQLVVMFELTMHRHLTESEILRRQPYLPRIIWKDPLDCRLVSLTYIEPIYWPFED